MPLYDKSLPWVHVLDVSANIIIIVIHNKIKM